MKELENEGKALEVSAHGRKNREQGMLQTSTLNQIVMHLAPALKNSKQSLAWSKGQKPSPCSGKHGRLKKKFEVKRKGHKIRETKGVRRGAQPKAVETARSQTPRDGNRAAGFASRGLRDETTEDKTPQNHCWMCVLTPTRLRFPRGAAEALGRVLLFSWEASSLPKQGHLLEEILLTGFLAPSWGTRCPLGVPWSSASALAVMPERFPAERAP